MNFLKNLFIKTNTLKESIENALANALEKISKNEKIDTIETKLIASGIKAGSVYFKGNLNPEQCNQIAKEIVKGIRRLNPIIIRQLRK